MPPTQITDHAAQATARLATQFRQTASIPALVAALCGRVQAFEDGLFPLLSMRDPSQLSGVPLASLEHLNGADLTVVYTDDPSVRLVIGAQPLVNRSSGTLEDLISIFRSAYPAIRLATREFPPGYVEFEIVGQAWNRADEILIAQLLIAARVAGTKLGFVYSGTSEQATLIFSISTGTRFGLAAGTTILPVFATSGLAQFPTTGTLTIDDGVHSETKTYSGVEYGVGSILLASGLINAYTTNAIVTASASVGGNFGDTSNPATGGVFATYDIW